MHEPLPQRLRVLRARKGWTLVEAARRAGIGRDTLSDLERGRQHPGVPTLTKIARGYGVPVEELLGEPAYSGKYSAPPAGHPEVKGPDPANQVEEPQFDPDTSALRRNVWERATEHARRWSARADMLEQLEARSIGTTYPLVSMHGDDATTEAVFVLRDMMALVGRPLTGEWLGLGVAVREATDRVRSAAYRLAEEYREVQAEEAAAYREMFGAVRPGPEETSEEEYDNVIPVAFGETNGNGEHRSAG